jgi:hypothetical protein
MSRLGLILPGSEEFSLPTSLEEIADLSPADDDFVQHKSGAWANRTVAQVKNDLGITDEQLQDLLGAMVSGGRDEYRRHL